MSPKPTYEELERQIRALKAKNDALRHYYGAVVDNSLDAVLLTAPDGRVFFANRAACDLFQMTEEEIISGGRWAVVDADDPNLPIAIEERARTGKFIGEIRLKKKDGTIFPAEVSSSIFKKPEGQALTSMVIRDLTERKRLEEYLRKYQNIVSSTPDGIAFLDQAYRYIIVNRSYEKFSNIAREHFIGKTVAEYLGEDMFNRKIKPSFDRCLQGEIVNFRGWFDYPTLGRRFVDVTYYPYRDNSNHISGVIANTKDITERKQAEEALKESEERQKQIIENSSAGYFFVDDQGRFQQVNSAWLHLHKYENANEVIGQHFSLTQVEDHLQDASNIVDQLLAGKAVITGEYSRKCKDNSVGYHTFTTRPVIKQGRIIGLEGFLIDITERRQTEEALRKSEAKYRSMMESMIDPVYICSPEFTVQYMNPAMIRRTGRDAVGEKCYRALHDLDDRCEWCIFERISAGESIETSIVSPKDHRHYRVTNMPLQNPDGSTSKMTIFRDITDYVTAIEEKEKVKVQLLQSQKMESIGNLAGGIAHDFNNILSAIIGYTELALDDIEKGTPLEDSLQEVYTASHRAKDLVRQILTFARQSNEERKPIRVASIAEEVLKLIRATIPSTIEIRPTIESHSLILGNSTHVSQIFMNLCTNAAHAMEDSGGNLDILVKDVIIDKPKEPPEAGLNPGHYVQIKVTDTGTGIAPDIIDSIFDPYFSTKKPGQGTGMGLAMVHGIVESYDGKITVQSHAGIGTVFRIYLPVTGERDDYHPYEQAGLPLGHERILLVDDEAPIAKIGSQILERLGYHVTTRTSSIEALELLRSKPADFDLLITDMTMPNMTGDKLALELLKIRPDMPVILCTGYSSRISEDSAAKMGISAFVYKPIVKADLANTIRIVLDDSKRSRQAINSADQT